MFCKAALAALVTVLLPVSASAQEWATKMFATISHDFGTVARGEKAEYAFELENLYVEEVHIASVRASCSCTSPKIVTPTLTTHEKGVILAKFNTSAFLGYRGATLTVTFDKPQFAEVQLQVHGYILGDLTFDPGIVDFGEVDEGNASEQEILVNHAGDDGWRIVATHCADSYLSATATEVSRRGGQVAYRIAVRLEKQAPSGYFASHLILDTGGTRQVSVPVTGMIRTPISLSPESLFLGPVEPGQTVTKQLVVRSRQPFRVSEAACDSPAFTVVVQDGASEKKVHLISVTFQAGKKSGTLQAHIYVATSIGNAPPATVHAVVQSTAVSAR
jgi:hypothetical protein